MKNSLSDQFDRVMCILRTTYIRTNDGKKHIINPYLNYTTEKEILRIQYAMGAENRKIINKELRRKGFGEKEIRSIARIGLNQEQKDRLRAAQFAKV